MRLHIELTPTYATFALISQARKRKSAEFTPLSRVASLAETKDVNPEHVRIKGANGDFVVGTSREPN